MDLERLDKEAPQGAFSTFDAEILIPEIEKLNAGDSYVEIGVDKGRSLWVASQAAKTGVSVVGIDIKDPVFIEGTVFKQGKSEEIAKTWANGKIAVLFIDGDHSYEGCKTDIKSWYPYMKEDGVMLFHDCDESSPGVVQAVAEFVNTHKVNKWELFKRIDKDTSMSKVEL